MGGLFVPMTFCAFLLASPGRRPDSKYSSIYERRDSWVWRVPSDDLTKALARERRPTEVRRVCAYFWLVKCPWSRKGVGRNLRGADILPRSLDASCL